MPADKPRRLGRGLEALISASGSATTAPAPNAAPSGEQTSLTRIPLEQIRPNPLQPRRDFDQSEIEELAASLRSSGLLQPITVRPSPGTRGYELVAGERRYRAARSLGWADIPAIIRDVDDRTLLTLALVENLQREDLNPIDEAEGYQRLIGEFRLTQQQVADAVGKDRSTVNNTLRLLSLPASVRALVSDEKLAVGHARPLLALPTEQQMLALAHETIASGLSVREVERRVSTAAPDRRKSRKHRPSERQNAEVRRIEDQLRGYLQTPVRIHLTDVERGTIHIDFFSADDLERVLDLILGQHRHAG